jgi:hypothetical protein
MADVTTNALRGIIKTLSDVVAPAIPADDPLALQELKMVVRYLNFARERIDHLYARARYELTFYSGLIAEVTGPLDRAYASHARALRDLSDRAKGLLAQPGAGIEELRDLNLEITSRISAILHDVSDPAILAQLERTVVLESAEVTAFERSWYAPLKLERFPDQVRPLGSFIPARQSLF